jgi:hypothetical protein
VVFEAPRRVVYEAPRCAAPAPVVYVPVAPCSRPLRVAVQPGLQIQVAFGF